VEATWETTVSLSDQPAFPVPGHVTGDHDRNGDPIVVGAETGMTYRQWLVGKALEGLLANPNVVYSETVGKTPEQWKTATDSFAVMAVTLADAAIRAQEKS
jgi:hypothetical protein